ncbi:MAG: sulfatase-like hydrolase/transferase [Candidatus Latescibacteria bacterium]|nr:sulfatase-like hydrolase/transferase [Candidatus Latescibacterota bacterium]
MTFDRTFTPCGLCSPARASMLTGLYPHAHQVLTNVELHPVQTQLAPAADILYSGLKAQGYRLGCAGKWHVNIDQDPTAFGVERYVSAKDYLAHRRQSGIPLPPESNNYVQLVTAVDPAPVEFSRPVFLAGQTVVMLRQFSADPERPFFVRLDFDGPHPGPSLQRMDRLLAHRRYGGGASPGPHEPAHVVSTNLQGHLTLGPCKIRLNDRILPGGATPQGSRDFINQVAPGPGPVVHSWKSPIYGAKGLRGRTTTAAPTHRTPGNSAPGPPVGQRRLVANGFGGRLRPVPRSPARGPGTARGALPYLRHQYHRYRHPVSGGAPLYPQQPAPVVYPPGHQSHPRRAVAPGCPRLSAGPLRRGQSPRANGHIGGSRHPDPLGRRYSLPPRHAGGQQHPAPRLCPGEYRSPAGIGPGSGRRLRPARRPADPRPAQPGPRSGSGRTPQSRNRSAENAGPTRTAGRRTNPGIAPY